MLKLHASFSKKVPIQGQDYSSQSYHATIESELPDGLTSGQLRDRIHETFELVRTSVEDELRQNHPPRLSQPDTIPAIPETGRNGNPQPASPRQLEYLRDLGARMGYAKPQLDRLAEERHGARAVDELDRNQASALIDELTANTRQRPRAARRAA